MKRIDIWNKSKTSIKNSKRKIEEGIENNMWISEKYCKNWD